MITIGCSLLAHLAFLYLLHLLPPAPTGSWAWDAWDERNDRFVKILIQAAEERRSAAAGGGETGFARNDTRVARTVWPFGRGAAYDPEPEDELAELLGRGPRLDYGAGWGIRAGHGGSIGEGSIGLSNISGGSRMPDPDGPRARPLVETGELTVRGELSEELIRRILDRHLNVVKYCWEKQRREPEDLEVGARERVVVKIIIGGAGAVLNAAVASSTLADGKVDRCIARAARRWTFPQPEGGGVAIVNATFLLEFGSPRR